MGTVFRGKETHVVGPLSQQSGGRLHGWLGTVLLTVLCALLMAWSASGATNPFADVPKGHWSYAALAEFAGLGLIEGYSEDAFRGERVITRYEMAWIIARLGDRLRTPAGPPSVSSSPGGSAALSGSPGGGQLSPALLSLKQRELLVRLQDEFASELALVAGTSGRGLPGSGAGQHGGSGGISGSTTGPGTTGTAALGVPLVQLGLPGLSEPRSPDGLSGSPEQAKSPGLSAASSSLKLRPDPGFIAAIAALPGEAGPQAFSGGKRLSELIGTAQGAGSGVGASGSSQGSQKKALTIPLEDGARAELSIGGPPMPGGIAPEEGDDVIARLDLKYALSQLAIFRASYELVKDGAGASDGGEGSAARATALLGIDYNFALSDSAFIKAGYTYSKITDLVPRGVEWGAPGAGEKPKEGPSKAAGLFGDYTLPGLSLDARKTTASLGVGYTFGGTASVMLGYRLIDFQELNPESQLPGVHRTNVATAELTIRF
ncbi:MAG: S-layer homology domain-containing protein [Bacillota bacterium]